MAFVVEEKEGDDWLACGHKHRTEPAAKRCMDRHTGCPVDGRQVRRVVNTVKVTHVEYTTIWDRALGEAKCLASAKAERAVARSPGRYSYHYRRTQLIGHGHGNWGGW